MFLYIYFIGSLPRKIDRSFRNRYGFRLYFNTSNPEITEDNVKSATLRLFLRTLGNAFASMFGLYV